MTAQKFTTAVIVVPVVRVLAAPTAGHAMLVMRVSKMNKIKITGKLAIIGPDNAVLALGLKQPINVEAGGINCVFGQGRKVTVFGSVVLAHNGALVIKARKILGKKPPPDSLKRRPRWVKGKEHKWQQ